MIRKALLTHKFIGYGLGLNDFIPFEGVRNAAASTLYIDLVSILDKATGMDKKSLRELRDSGYLLEGDALTTIRNRRHRIAHNLEGVTVTELEESIKKVEEQLIDWKLLKGPKELDVSLERSGMKDSADPRNLGEWEYKVIVKERDRIVAEVKQTKRLSRD